MYFLGGVCGPLLMSLSVLGIWAMWKRAKVVQEEEDSWMMYGSPAPSSLTVLEEFSRGYGKPGQVVRYITYTICAFGFLSGFSLWSVAPDGALTELWFVWLLYGVLFSIPNGIRPTEKMEEQQTDEPLDEWHEVLEELNVPIGLASLGYIILGICTGFIVILEWVWSLI